MKSALLKLFVLFMLPTFALGQSSDNKFQPLLDKAKKSHSDALVVFEDGEKVVEYYSDSENKKIQSMSVTKSVVGLAMAKLLTDNMIDSLETPVAHYYPEWRQGQKKNITIRHLMNHTSGLQNVGNANKEVNPAPDFIKLGLCASVVNKPGTEFSYNNKAVNILSGIVKKVAEKPIDNYLRDNLFKEMGIVDYEWGTDENGNHAAMSGLKIKGDDLAKLGQLVLQNGSWEGNQLIAKKQIDELLDQGQPHTIESGLLWWRIPKNKKYIVGEEQIDNMKKAGVDSRFLSKMEKIKGEYKSEGSVVNAIMGQFEGRKQLMTFRKATLGQGIAPYKESVSEPIIGYKASGDLGQYLVIYPDENVVAARMIQRTDSYNQKTDYFGNFGQLVYNLASQH